MLFVYGFIVEKLNLISVLIFNSSYSRYFWVDVNKKIFCFIVPYEIDSPH